MITLNPQYEAIFDARNIDEDCNKIADEINDVARMQIQEMVNHFVDDEHFCYFDDMYSPEYSLQWIYEDIIKYDIDEESRKLLEDGHKEILQSECYEEYGCPSYIR